MLVGVWKMGIYLPDTGWDCLLDGQRTAALEDLYRHHLLSCVNQ
jgi:hypothetical protein